MFKFLIKSLGVSTLLHYAWSAAKPELEAWAQSDGEDDWDDKVVEFMDKVVVIIIGKLSDEGK